jgi:hypothetical protein
MYVDDRITGNHAFLIATRGVCQPCSDELIDFVEAIAEVKLRRHSYGTRPAAAQRALAAAAPDKRPAAP